MYAFRSLISSVSHRPLPGSSKSRPASYIFSLLPPFFVLSDIRCSDGRAIFVRPLLPLLYHSSLILTFGACDMNSGRRIGLLLVFFFPCPPDSRSLRFHSLFKMAFSNTPPRPTRPPSTKQLNLFWSVNSSIDFPLLRRASFQIRDSQPPSAGFLRAVIFSPLLYPLCFLVPFINSSLVGFCPPPSE